tara:strand:- start:377 stop:532 length:156 start_codon:yes stop_codon:yes gene_type:complete
VEEDQVEEDQVDLIRDHKERRKADVGDGKKSFNLWILLHIPLKMHQFLKVR